MCPPGYQHNGFDVGLQIDGTNEPKSVLQAKPGA